MSRYFFDLDEDGDVTADHEGRELPDVAAARDQAIREARALLSSDVSHGKLRLDSRIRVREAGGAEVLAVNFAEALTSDRMAPSAPTYHRH